MARLRVGLAAGLLAAVASVGVGEVRQRARIAAVNRAYERHPSPNHGGRPLFARVDCVVLHATATDSFPETVRILSSPRTGVSAHFLVGKDGRVVNLVPIERRAWHAGVSMLDGRPDVNSRSVGIEILNRNDGLDPYTAAQYRAVAGILRSLRTCYRIPDERVVSHADVALPPGRKSDPLGFDFDRVRRLARR